MTGKIMEKDVRPWGDFITLSHTKIKDESGKETDLVMKKITVLAGKRLSYQSHKGRDEKWHVISGVGVATIEGKEVELETGSEVMVKKGEKHRIANTGTAPLIFSEESRGDFDEDDIVRYEDDFGRAK